MKTVAWCHSFSFLFFFAPGQLVLFLLMCLFSPFQHRQKSWPVCYSRTCSCLIQHVDPVLYSMHADSAPRRDTNLKRRFVALGAQSAREGTCVQEFFSGPTVEGNYEQCYQLCPYTEDGINPSHNHAQHRLVSISFFISSRQSFLV